MIIHVIHLKKSYYWTLAAMIVVGLFWYTGVLEYAEIPVSGLAPYYHGNPNLAKISLTINVDWGQENIPKMLDILREKDVKATFFITGRWAEKFPEIVKKIHAAGHEIGVHGYSHVNPTTLSGENFVQHIKKNEEIIYQLTGQKNYIYAPPAGYYNKKTVEMAAQLGYKVIMWSADTIDWQEPSPDIIIKRVMRKASNGGIVLMHPKPQTLEALPLIIDELRAKGYQLVTITELLELKSGESNGS